MNSLRAKRLPWLSTILLACVVACADRSSSQRTEAQQRLVSVRQRQADTAGCQPDSTRRFATPRALMNELMLFNDSAGAIAPVEPWNRWPYTAVLCSDDDGGADAAWLVYGHSIDSLTQIADTILFRVTYRMAAELTQDETGLRLLQAPATDTITVRVVSTRYGWKLRDFPGGVSLLSVARGRFSWSGEENIRPDTATVLPAKRPSP